MSSTSRDASTSFQRLLKTLLTIGLCGLVLAVLTRKRMGLVARSIVLLSKYRELLPYMTAQAKLETANFTSKVYLTDHNMFGMKWTNGRRGQNATKGLQAPEYDNGQPTYYAHFVTDSASVIDLLKWFEAKNFPVRVKDTYEYSELLRERGYFGTSEQARVVYQKNLDYWMNKT